MHDLGKNNRKDSSVFGRPLFAWLVCILLGGIAGVALDLDHILAYYGFTYTQDMWHSRPLHIPLAIIACGVGIYSIACLRRLARRKVLEKKDNQ